jgi:hypothetical protein
MMIAGAFGAPRGVSLYRLMVILVGFFLIILYLVLIGRIRSRILIGIVVSFYTYLLCESILSLLYMLYLIEPSYSAIAIEDTARTVHFDPIRGTAMVGNPSRIARYTNGALEYVGAFRGNNYRYQDRDDISPQRNAGEKKRIAVFGDSFTAAEYLEWNWPDRAERMQGSIGLKLMNFSIFGGGLANWWSTLTKIVEAERFELDGIIFAVHPTDLWRKFAFARNDDPAMDTLYFGRWHSWDPNTYPTDVAVATRSMTPGFAYLLSPPEFQSFLAGRWRPPFGRERFKFYLTYKLLSLFVKPPSLSNPPRQSDVHREWIIADLQRALKRIGVPILVVYVPAKGDLLAQQQVTSVPTSSPSGEFSDARSFAESIGAKFVDGRSAFSGMTSAEISKAWLPLERHWSQVASDRFADFMVQVLSDWPK